MTEKSVDVTGKRPRFTLRRRLLLHVLLAVLIVWIASTFLVTQIALVFALRAFDRALLDDAYAISAHVRQQPDGAVKLEISSRELESVLFDQSERVFFAVFDRNGNVVADNAPWLLASDAVVAAAEGGAPLFSDRSFTDGDLRAVELPPTTTRNWRIRVAQTVRSRSDLVSEMTLFVAIPQVVFLMLLGAWLWRVIGNDLKPLNRLREALQSRDVNDLSAVKVNASALDIAQLTDATNALFDRIRLGVSAQREFAGNVAHELRNPLAGIQALAEYGLRHEDPALWKTQLHGILERQHHASHLLEQLLALAFADEARDTVKLTKVRLNDIVERCAVAALPQVDAQQIDLSVHGLDEPVFALGNEALLIGILTNLLDNAIRYAKPAAPLRATIELRVEQELASGRITLSVCDNGPGLSDALIEARKRWQRGAGVEAIRGGVGLGLAIVTRYAELMNASITFTNRVPSGLSVTLQLISKTADLNRAKG